MNYWPLFVITYLGVVTFGVGGCLLFGRERLAAWVNLVAALGAIVIAAMGPPK